MSGLSAVQKIKARDLAVQAAILGLRNAPYLHYTQLGDRWQGIDHDLKAWRGQYPTEADCSSFLTWCVWNGLDHFGVRDTVNGQGWESGYTGTIVEHAVKVPSVGHLLRADGVVYGNPFGRTGHTALIAGKRAGVPMVVSNGSEGGPYYEPFNYRTDIFGFYRFI